jgi:hypothetical protein
VPTARANAEFKDACNRTPYVLTSREEVMHMEIDTKIGRVKELIAKREELDATEKQCVSFSFISSRNRCKLYSSADSHKAQEGVDSGTKRQAP